MYSILIVEIRSGQWSFAIAQDDKRIYSALEIWDTPRKAFETAIEYFDLL